MSIQPFDPDIRVCLAIVSLGTPERLRDCINSLLSHASRHDFSVVCVVNPTSADDEPDSFEFAPQIHVIHTELNLGWPGGLHVARAATTAEYLVWVQEDMQVMDGWLDALVDAADSNPDTAAFGSLTVDSEGRPSAIGAGTATPFHDVDQWNQTGFFGDTDEKGITHADWITGKGMLTRTSAWDLVGGTDPHQYPLNLVDKDYSTHLRAHGLLVALVPSARLFHLQGQSAPSMFRRFVGEYRNPAFNRQWGPVVEMLAPKPAPVSHVCAPWFTTDEQRANPVPTINALVGREASTLLIAFAKWATWFTDVSVEHQANVDRHEASVERARLESAMTDLLEQLQAAHDERETLEGHVSLQAAAARAVAALREGPSDEPVEILRARHETATAYESTISWRVTKPLRAVRVLFRRRA